MVANTHHHLWSILPNKCLMWTEPSLKLWLPFYSKYRAQPEKWNGPEVQLELDQEVALLENYCLKQSFRLDPANHQRLWTIPPVGWNSYADSFYSRRSVMSEVTEKGTRFHEWPRRQSKSGNFGLRKAVTKYWGGICRVGGEGGGSHQPQVAGNLEVPFSGQFFLSP